MSFTHALSTGNYGPAKIIVATSAANGTHISLTTAMAAASAGDTIFLRDSVTENVTITPGVNIAAFQGSAANTPTITGKLTMTGAGTSTISGIKLTTNSDNVIAVTGSAASILNVVDCYLNFSNTTGITYSSSQATSAINIIRCTGDVGTTGIALHAHTAAGALSYEYCHITNSGSSTTVSNNSAGSVFLAYSNITGSFSTSSTGSVTATYSILSAPGAASVLTLAGTGTSAAEATRFNAGSGSAISIGSGTVLEVKGYIDVISSNTNAITGAGTIKYNRLDYYSSAGNNVTTKTAYTSEFGIQTSTTQPSFLASVSGVVSNVTGDGTDYTMIGNDEIFDQNSNYNPSTGVITANITGKYNISGTVGISNIGASHTTYTLKITSSNRQYNCFKINPTAVKSSADYSAVFATLCDMDAADTATLIIQVAGSTKTIGLRTGPTTDMYTYISGTLVC